MQRPVRTAAVMAALALASCTSNAESPPGSPSATSAVVAGTTTVPIVDSE